MNANEVLILIFSVIGGVVGVIILLIVCAYFGTYIYLHSEDIKSYLDKKKREKEEKQRILEEERKRKEEEKRIRDEEERQRKEEERRRKEEEEERRKEEERRRKEEKEESERRQKEIERIQKEEERKFKEDEKERIRLEKIRKKKEEEAMKYEKKISEKQREIERLEMQKNRSLYGSENIGGNIPVRGRGRSRGRGRGRSRGRGSMRGRGRGSMRGRGRGSTRGRGRGRGMYGSGMKPNVPDDLEEIEKIKVVIVGDGAVGKTSLLYVYGDPNNSFPTDYVPTVVDNYSITIDINGRDVILNAWDTAGQEDYKNYRQLSYNEVDVFVLCFSVTNRTSFENIKTDWYYELKDRVGSKILLVGTKIDLRNDKEKIEELKSMGEKMVTKKEGIKLKKGIKAVGYFECSALQNIGVKEVFDESVKIWMKENKSKTKKKSFVSTPTPQKSLSNKGKRPNPKTYGNKIPTPMLLSNSKNQIPGIVKLAKTSNVPSKFKKFDKPTPSDEYENMDVVAVKRVKVVIVGDGAVGKTSLLFVYGDPDNFDPEQYVPTIVDNYSVEVEANGTPYKIDLWDTAGQEDYQNIRTLSYIDVDVFILCFSVVDRTSFENIEYQWFPEISSGCPDAQIILVGTKMDLREDVDILADLKTRDEKPVTKKEGERKRKAIKAVKYMESSAIENEGVSEIFNESLICYLTKNTKKKKEKKFDFWKLMRKKSKKPPRFLTPKDDEFIPEVQKEKPKLSSPYALDDHREKIKRLRQKQKLDKINSDD